MGADRYRVCLTTAEGAGALRRPRAGSEGRASTGGKQDGVRPGEKLGESQSPSGAWLGPRGFCDPAPTASIGPSRNTDQGVYHLCEFAGGKPIGVVKVKGAKAVSAGSISRPWSSVKGASESIIDRTRKMVNYAWVAWSRGKPWWRCEAILTCKSFVELEYRGERLIEPSSSWFPLKFLSG